MALHILSLSFLMLMVPLLLSAHQPTGTVHGRVLDEHGRPVQSARVSIEGSEQAGLTDIGGGFKMVGVTAGRQNLVVRLGGRTDRSVGVMVRPGGVVRVEATIGPRRGYMVRGAIISSPIRV